MVLGVDSVADVVVVGNSGVRIGVGPGKDDETADTDRGRASRSECNSVDRTGGLPGNGTSLAIIVVEIDEISSMSEGERVVERSEEGAETCTPSTPGAGGMTWTAPSTGWVMTGSGSTT